MKKSKSIQYRRAGVLINLLSLILFCYLFEVSLDYSITTVIIVAKILLLIVLALSFWLTYVRTGIWKQVHLPKHKLDEREVLVIYDALRWSYSIFSIFVLCLIYIFLFLGRNIGAVTAAGLIYFAHIIPASILAWKEKMI